MSINHVQEQFHLTNGPMSLLYRAILSNTSLLVKIGNDLSIIGKLRSYDLEYNMVMGSCREIRTDLETGQITIRSLGTTFVRGEEVQLVIRNPRILGPYHNVILS